MIDTHIVCVCMSIRRSVLCDPPSLGSAAFSDVYESMGSDTSWSVGLFSFLLYRFFSSPLADSSRTESAWVWSENVHRTRISRVIDAVVFAASRTNGWGGMGGGKLRFGADRKRYSPPPQNRGRPVFVEIDHGLFSRQVFPRVNVGQRSTALRQTRVVFTLCPLKR